jgi:hypothetical protein
MLIAPRIRSFSGFAWEVYLLVLAHGLGVASVGLRGRIGMRRARQAGMLRSDVTVDDLAFVIWGISRTVEMTADLAPQLWRRHLALLLDGFRAEGAHRLPESPLASGLSHTAAHRSPSASTA